MWRSPVARVLWEHDAAGSNPVTPTKNIREVPWYFPMFFASIFRFRASQTLCVCNTCTLQYFILLHSMGASIGSESCHSDHFGSEKQFSEPFSLSIAPQKLRADRFFCQPFGYLVLLDKLEFDNLCYLFFFPIYCHIKIVSKYLWVFLLSVVKPPSYRFYKS